MPWILEIDGRPVLLPADTTREDAESLVRTLSRSTRVVLTPAPSIIVGASWPQVYAIAYEVPVVTVKRVQSGETRLRGINPQ